MRRLILIAVSFGLVTAAAQPGMFQWTSFWGTWVWQTHLGPGMALPALITYHSDWTITGADGTMFGGLPNAATQITPLHGVWKPTGGPTIGGTSLYLVFNSTTSLLSAFARARSTLTLTHDLDHFQGKMFIELLPCSNGPLACPDPLDPAAQWVPYPNMPPDGFDVSAGRLQRVPAGPLQP